MKSIKKIFFGLLILIPFVFNSCFSVKTQSSKSGKHLYESFYVGEEGTQYFIKPLEFISPNSKTKMLLDATFRYKDTIKDSAIVNFSILQPEKYPPIKSLDFSNGQIKYSSILVELMFYQKKKNLIESRYTSKFALADYVDFFCIDNIKIIVNGDSVTTHFAPTKKTVKNIGIIKDKVFVLMTKYK